MRAVAYIRVSTAAQSTEDKVSLSEQKLDIENHCAAKGYDLVNYYTDAGYSGASKRRPAFQTMLKDAQTDKFDVVVCWKSDRLSRGLFPAAAVMESIEGTAVTLEAVKDHIDLNSFGLMAVVGKIELENIRERARMGRRGRAAQGRLSGTVKYGYQLGVDRRAEVNPEEAETVQFIIEWRSQGIGSREIATRLNDAGRLTRKGKPWDDQKIWLIVVDPVYTGRGSYGRRQYYTKDDGVKDVRKTRQMPPATWLDVAYPRLVDDETWALAQLHRKHSTRERLTGKPKPEYFLRGLLWCDYCQGKYTVATSYAYKYHRQPDGTKTLDRSQRVIRKYVCGRGKSQHAGCPKQSVSAMLIERIVWAELTRFLTNPSEVAALADERRRQLVEGGAVAEATRIQARLDSVETERERTLTLYAKGYINDGELDLKMAGMADTIEYHRQELKRLASESDNLTHALEFLEQYQNVAASIADRLDTMDDTERKEVARLLVNRVGINGQDYQITLALDTNQVGVLDNTRPHRHKTLSPTRCPTLRRYDDYPAGLPEPPFACPRDSLPGHRWRR